ncbi:hypothetical protein P9F83_03260 [Peribacillus psychrosaccharolyticus]|uniref:hypothetical protein n=1 Tax=Peribacillus psychrosaccharolyticus TaxID=1407 RepID=UPI002DBB5567|nr:hypothetical protein [Peribacillus psychrosaccharolyticus]MEC2054254.1 hypothetical protein [Peribacillus psychrosaccharolyticus]MED3746657.1 hypothetical protein [Peribacillus psychrosaccharolyticus]
MVSSIVVVIIALISLIDDGLASMFEVFAIFPMYVFTLVILFGVPLSFLIDFLTRDLSKNKSIIEFFIYLLFGSLFGLLFFVVFPEIVPLTVVTGLIVSGLFYSCELIIKKGGKQKQNIKYISFILLILIVTLNIVSFSNWLPF